MKYEDMICTMHEEIMSICREQLEALPPEAESPQEYSGVYEAFRDIMKEADKAMNAGQAMEDRLVEYRTAITRLGFVRVGKEGA